MEKLDENVEREYVVLFSKYTYAIRKLKADIENALDEYTRTHDGYNPIDHTKERIKKFKSAANKLKKRGIEVTPETMEKELSDMVGFRIVCPFESDVYEVVNQIKRSGFTIVNEDDYIKHPKKSGYRSYHIDVAVPISIDNEIVYVNAEIQIRTMAMDLWAELDHRLRYKLSDDIGDMLSTEFLARASDIARFDTRMEALKEEVEEMKQEEVYQNQEPMPQFRKIMPKGGRK